MSPEDVIKSGAQIFNALGVKNILWIDDFFHHESGGEDFQTLTDELKSEINNLFDAGELETLFELGVLPEGSANVPEPVKRRIAKDRVDKEELDISMLANKLLGRSVKIVKESGASDQTCQGEMAPQQFEATLDIFKELANDVDVFSFTKWFESKDSIQVDENTLVFVDLHSNEPSFEGDTGINVIEYYSKSLHKSHLPIFVVLTFECSEYDEEEKREHIFSRIKSEDVENDFFQVMAKSRLSDNSDIERNLVVNIKRLFLRKVSFGIARLLIADVVEAINKTKDDILGQGIYDISSSIYESSHKEGVSEIEVFHRLFSITQRMAIYGALKKSHSIANNLVTLRNINKSIKDDIVPAKPNAFFADLRRSEVFLNADDINNIFDPLSPGDIFEFSYTVNGNQADIKVQEFILVTQPCDMLLRSKDGGRKTNVGVLVPVKKVKFGNSRYRDKKASPAYHEFFIDKVSEQAHLAELNSGFHVNLNVLDWCSFNSDGRVVFCSKSERPALVHLDGHIKRFDELLSLSQPAEKESNNRFPKVFGLDRPVFEAEQEQFMLPDFVVEKVGADYRAFSVPLRRSGRLHGVHFEHLLRSYFSYRARQAFDHDFV